MNKKLRKIDISLQILIGMALGIVLGLFLQGTPQIATKYIQPVGTLFLNLVKMIIVPLVFSSLICGACGLGDIKKVGRIGIKTVLFFLMTTAVAVTIGLAVGTLFRVGVGISIPVDATFEATAAPSLVDTLLGIVPTNPFLALTQGNMLQIITFALLIGVSICAVGDKAAGLKDAIEGFAEVMYTMTGAIMKLAPYGVFALMTPVVATNGASVLLPLLGLVLAVYTACTLHALITYSTCVKFLGKTSPIAYYKALLPAMLFAFSSASSAATLPLNMEAAKKLGVHSSIRSFVLPLGATINMDGTAVFQGICALFIAQIYHVDLSVAQMLTIILSATIASVGTAGVPGAGTVMLGMVLLSVGLPVDGIAIIMGVERILDMARTTVNIMGDCACAVVVNASEK